MTMKLYGFILYVVLAPILLPGVVHGFRVGYVALPTSKISLLTRSPRLTYDSLLARPYRKYAYEGDKDHTNGLSDIERRVNRPTQTRPDVPRAPVLPSKPKIVVLGASGMIGRLVVRQLLEMSHLDATIVAFVRDYDKACRLLYDDVLVASANRNRRGPLLQILTGDLVPLESLPGYVKEQDDKAWLHRAESAAAFFGKKIQEFDNKMEDIVSDEETLRSAIEGCTTIINCVGSVRPTNMWTDLLARPLWRLLRSDVSGWCKDRRHPFYVHYQVTKNVLQLVEAEQIRREQAASEAADSSTRVKDGCRRTIPRIRFIRISDLCVTQAPWCLVPVLTNLLHSMVFRYQDMAEKAMESSPLVDTVTIRPGDLVDDERDIATTSLQVDCSGSVPCPARVGREDVAALAVSAALFDSTEELAEVEHPPFHYTFACRWTSETMDPYPPQGHKSDGHTSASEGLQSALLTIRKRSRKTPSRRRRSWHFASTPPDLTNGGVASLATEPRGDMAVQSRRKQKPYGIFVALTAYTMFWWILRSVHYYMLPILFPGFKAKSWSLRPWRILHGLSASALGGLHQLRQGCISLWAFPTWMPRPCDTKYIPF